MRAMTERQRNEGLTLSFQLQLAILNAAFPDLDQHELLDFAIKREIVNLYEAYVKMVAEKNGDALM